MVEDGYMEAEITYRVLSGWGQRKRVGVLCYRRFNLSVKGKGYQTVVVPAIMSGTGRRALKKPQKEKFDVTEMVILRWMCGVTKLDRVRDNTSWRNIEEYAGNEGPLVWTCNERRRGECGGGFGRCKEGEGMEEGTVSRRSEREERRCAKPGFLEGSGQTSISHYSWKRCDT